MYTWRAKMEEKIREDISPKKNRLGHRGTKRRSADWAAIWRLHDHGAQMSTLPTRCSPFHTSPSSVEFLVPCVLFAVLGQAFIPHPPCTTCIWNLWFDLLPWLTFGCKCSFLVAAHLLFFLRFFLPFHDFSFFGFMFSPAKVAHPNEEKHQHRECPSQGSFPWRRPGEEGLWHRHVETQWEAHLEEAFLQGSLQPFFTPPCP